MTRKHEEATLSRHIQVWESDWVFLQKHFGLESEERVGVSVAIRAMIRKGVREYQERLARRAERASAAAHAAGGEALAEFFPKGDLE